MTVKPRKAKLPVKQLAILAICRFAEPITLTSVFPYLYFMIESFGIEKEKIGFYAGILSASFSVSQVFTAIWWGRMSDRFGRKPIILLGLMGTMASALAFGFSKNLTMAIIARCCLGALNGNIGILRSVVAELIGDNKELQSTAFCLLPLVWSFGSIIGPVLGGVLSQPSIKYPELFPPGSLLDRYPFALPNIVGVCFLFFGFVFGIFFLEETLETRKHAKDPGLIIGKKITRLLTRKSRGEKSSRDDERTPLLDGNATRKYLDQVKDDEEHQPLKSKKQLINPMKPPTMREVFTRQSTFNILVYFQLALHNIAFDQLVPILLSTDPANRKEYPFHFPFSFSGGFGKSASQVGSFFSIYGVVCMIMQIFVFPPVTKRLGTLSVLRGAQTFYPIFYMLMPLTLFLPKGPLQDAGILLVMFGKGLCGIFSFPASTIMLTNSASGTRVLGTLNGVATCVTAIGRGIGPTFTGFVFSEGQKMHWGMPPWLVLTMFAILGGIPMRWLVEGNGLASKEEIEDEDDNHHAENSAAIETETINPPLDPEESRALEGEITEDHRNGPPTTRAHN